MAKYVTAALLLSVLATPVAAQIHFEAVISGHNAQIQFFISAPAMPWVQWINPNVDQAGLPFAVASADSLEVFGLSANGVFRVTPNGAVPLFNLPAGQFGQAIAVSTNGLIFVSTRTFVPTTRRLLVFTSTGTLQATYVLAVSDDVDVMIVGADGCTVFYAEGNVIHRINGCTGAALPDFATTGGTVHDIFPTAGGQFLVTSGSDVLLYDGSGTLVRTVATISSYTSDASLSPGQIALGADGQTLWMTTTGPSCVTEPFLLRLAFDDGEELSRQDINIDATTGLILSANGPGAAIPTTGTLALIFVALMIAAAGVVVLR